MRGCRACAGEADATAGRRHTVVEEATCQYIEVCWRGTGIMDREEPQERHMWKCLIDKVNKSSRTCKAAKPLRAG